MAYHSGDDNLMTTIVSRSQHLNLLDLSGTRFTLLETIITKLPHENKIEGINIAAINRYVHQELGDELRFDTIQMMVQKCRFLMDLILINTNFHEVLDQFLSEIRQMTSFQYLWVGNWEVDMVPVFHLNYDGRRSNEFEMKQMVIAILKGLYPNLIIQ